MLIKTDSERLNKLNKIISNILYKDSKIPKLETYKNEIVAICKHLESLRILKINISEKEYEYTWPKFVDETFNIFYLFPKVYEYEIKNSSIYEDYQDILISGLEMYQDN